MIYGIGVDLCDRRRILHVMQRHGLRFEQRLCAKAELALIQQAKHKDLALAKTFAAKEAVAKAMGTGIRGFEFKDIEIERNKQGRPGVILHPKALLKLRTLIGEHTQFSLHLSLSDEGDMAIAYAILETHDKEFM